MKDCLLPQDPVLVASDFRCVYCGRDLLADFESYLTITRDHLVPRCAGGPNGHENRVASCAACDRLKAGALVNDLAEARALVTRMRRGRRVWFERVRAAVRQEA